MALAGDHIIVKMDDSAGTLRFFPTGDIISVDLPMTYDQHDVTGFGDVAHKFINGQLNAPVTIRGYLTTTALSGSGSTATGGTHTIIKAVHAVGSVVSFEVHVGNNATPVVGDPRYYGEFYVESYSPTVESGKAVQFVATLKPATGAAPAWGVVV